MEQEYFRGAHNAVSWKRGPHSAGPCSKKYAWNWRTVAPSDSLSLNLLLSDRQSFGHFFFVAGHIGRQLDATV